jgi:hypothetical protein
VTSHRRPRQVRSLWARQGEVSLPLPRRNRLNPVHSARFGLRAEEVLCQEQVEVSVGIGVNQRQSEDRRDLARRGSGRNFKCPSPSLSQRPDRGVNGEPVGGLQPGGGDNIVEGVRAKAACEPNRAARLGMAADSASRLRRG